MALAEVVVATAEVMEAATVHHEVVVTEEDEAGSEAAEDTHHISDLVECEDDFKKSQTQRSKLSKLTREGWYIFRSILA